MNATIEPSLTTSHHHSLTHLALEICLFQDLAQAATGQVYVVQVLAVEHGVELSGDVLALLLGSVQEEVGQQHSLCDASTHTHIHTYTHTHIHSK
jgi:hypothetical protein